MRGLLVGFGSIGRRHLANLHALGVADWAVVHTGLGTIPLEAPCPVRSHPDLATALAAERPTFVVVANPTSLHLETARAAVDAGCHVLLEKPASHNLDGLHDLAAAVQANGVGMLVGFQFRFHPALRRITDLLEGGTLGSPLHVRAVWGEHLPSWHPWEDYRTGYAARPELGGGVHRTMCHPLDYLRMLLGDPVDVVAAVLTGGPLGLEVAESADVVLRFGAGVGAQLHLDYWTRPTEHHLCISCTEGALRWDAISGRLEQRHHADDAWTVQHLPGSEDRNDLFVAEAVHFLDVVGGARPSCTIEDGIRSVELIEAIERAATAPAANEPGER